MGGPAHRREALAEDARSVRGGAVIAAVAERVPSQAPPRPDYKRGFGWTLVFNALTKVATPLIGVFVARHLGPEVMGAYMVLVTVMTFADLFRDAGVSRVYLNERTMDEATERGFAAVSALLGLALGACMAATAVPIARLFDYPALAVGILFGAVAMALNGLSTVPQAKLLRHARFRRAAFAESFASVGSSAFALVLVLQGYGFTALAGQLVVRSLIFLGLTYAWAPCGFTGGDRSLARRIAKSSGVLTGINVMWVGFSVGDQALLAKLFGLGAAGVFGAGKMIVTSADVVAKPLTQTVTVAFAHRVGDRRHIARTMNKAMLAFMIAIAPIYVGVAFFSDPLVSVVLGPKFAGTIPVLPGLCLYGAAVYIGSFAGSALLVDGRPQIALHGWIGVYLGMAILVSAFGSQLPFPVWVWLFAAALLTVNLTTLGYAIARFRPSRRFRSHLIRAGGALIVTAAFAGFLVSAPLSKPMLLLLGLVILPVVHVAALGTFFLRNPSRMLSKAGAKALWRSL